MNMILAFPAVRLRASGISFFYLFLLDWIAFGMLLSGRYLSPPVAAEKTIDGGFWHPLTDVGLEGFLYAPCFDDTP